MWRMKKKKQSKIQREQLKIALFFYASIFGFFGRNSLVKNGIVNKKKRPYSGQIEVMMSEMKKIIGINKALLKDEI